MHRRMIRLAACLSAGLAAWALGAGVALAEEGESYQHAATNIRDTDSLQRGARAFMNYCSGCHSLKYLRYNRMAEDLKIPLAELAANLMFASDKPFDDIDSAMPADSENWFGKRPPDLSLTPPGTEYEELRPLLPLQSADEAQLLTYARALVDNN